MSGIRRLEHVELQVEELEPAVEFYTRVFGLIEMARDETAVYLGCGMDANYDLAVTEGGTGVAHFAVRATEDSFADIETSLDEHGVSVERTDGVEPGQRRGLRFETPSKRLTLEIVTVEETRYHNGANTENLPTTAAVHPERTPVAPIDLSHVTVMSPDIEADVEFLRDVVGFRISDVGRSSDDHWIMAFLRMGAYHHDVAIFDDPENSLHHLAWEVTDVSHLIRLVDHLASNGHELEASPVRHGPGSNIAAYFQEPGGNRFEITTEVASVDRDAKLVFHDVDTVPYSVWGGLTPPESFREGS